MLRRIVVCSVCVLLRCAVLRRALRCAVLRAVFFFSRVASCCAVLSGCVALCCAALCCVVCCDVLCYVLLVY